MASIRVPSHVAQRLIETLHDRLRRRTITHAAGVIDRSQRAAGLESLLEHTEEVRAVICLQPFRVRAMLFLHLIKYFLRDLKRLCCCWRSTDGRQRTAAVRLLTEHVYGIEDVAVLAEHHLLGHHNIIHLDQLIHVRYEDGT
jgi:hypothetical protein